MRAALSCPRVRCAVKGGEFAQNQVHVCTPLALSPTHSPGFLLLQAAQKGSTQAGAGPHNCIKFNPTDLYMSAKTAQGEGRGGSLRDP